MECHGGGGILVLLYYYEYDYEGTEKQGLRGREGWKENYIIY